MLRSMCGLIPHSHSALGASERMGAKACVTEAASQYHMCIWSPETLPDHHASSYPHTSAESDQLCQLYMPNAQIHGVIMIQARNTRRGSQSISLAGNCRETGHQQVHSPTAEGATAGHGCPAPMHGVDSANQSTAAAVQVQTCPACHGHHASFVVLGHSLTC